MESDRWKVYAALLTRHSNSGHLHILFQGSLVVLIKQAYLNLEGNNLEKDKWIFIVDISSDINL